MATECDCSGIVVPPSDSANDSNGFFDLFTETNAGMYFNWAQGGVNSIASIALLWGMFRSKETENILYVFLWLPVLSNVCGIVSGIGSRDSSQWGPPLLDLVLAGILPLCLKFYIEKRIPPPWQRLRRVLGEQCRYFSQHKNIMRLVNDIRDIIRPALPSVSQIVDSHLVNAVQATDIEYALDEQGRLPPVALLDMSEDGRRRSTDMQSRRSFDRYRNAVVRISSQDNLCTNASKNAELITTTTTTQKQEQATTPTYDVIDVEELQVVERVPSNSGGSILVVQPILPPPAVLGALLPADSHRRVKSPSRRRHNREKHNDGDNAEDMLPSPSRRMIRFDGDDCVIVDVVAPPAQPEPEHTQPDVPTQPTQLDALKERVTTTTTQPMPELVPATTTTTRLPMVLPAVVVNQGAHKHRAVRLTDAKHSR